MTAARAPLTARSASSTVSAIAVRCPIFRPSRGASFPYKCSFTRGSASTSVQSGSPRFHASPNKFAIAAGRIYLAGDKRLFAIGKK